MKKRLRVLVVHGPNLNLLGEREPAIYGATTLPQIDKLLVKEGKALGASVLCFQSNIEGEIVDVIQSARDTADGLVINAGGYTHTSVAIRDAIAAIALPAVEVHLSNTQARESFRHESRLAPVVRGRVEGFGPESYLLGLRGLISILQAGKSR